MGIVKRLPDDVVRVISAGEVIVRPANAVKELLENSLDANGTDIVVSIREGGLDFLQVRDNGCGVAREDLELVCERFTTSKLQSFDDLSHMNTFGFRGEALASIAMVASLSFVSKPLPQSCAAIVSYKLGEKQGEIRPCAGMNGTVVTVENMFEGNTGRRTTMKNGYEEAARCADIVSRYALHRPDIAFTFRRGGGGDFHTPGSGKVEDAIRVLYGADTATGVHLFSFADLLLQIEVNGFMSRPFPTKTAKSSNIRKNRQKTFLLFINGRSVVSTRLKSAVEGVLSGQAVAVSLFLISLKMDPTRVDVNVHPAKELVYFLDEDAIIEKISQWMEEELKKTLCVHQTDFALRSKATIPSQKESKHDKERRCDEKLVRVHADNRSLDEFLLSDHPMAHQPAYRITHVSQSNQPVSSLASVDALRRACVSASSREMRSFFSSLTLVGVVDAESVIVQQGTAMWSIKGEILWKELFYQLVLFSLGSLGSFRLSSPLPLSDLLSLCLQCGDGTPEMRAEGVRFLLDKADMLADLFSLVITDEGLLTVPCVLHGHIAQMEGIPELLGGLLAEVDWDDEETCIREVCMCVSAFLSPHACWMEDGRYSSLSRTRFRAVVSDLLMPAVRDRLIPPSKWADDGTLSPLADLPQLYKIFERC